MLWVLYCSPAIVCSSYWAGGMVGGCIRGEGEGGGVLFGLG